MHQFHSSWLWDGFWPNRIRGDYWIHCMLSDEETNLYVDTKHYSRIIDLGVTLASGYH
jgi:hypothetical protein